MALIKKEATMNKVAISKTAICYWSEEDDSYVVESSLFETIAGVGDTPEDAFRVFDDLLDDAYEAYLEGRVPGYDKPGRPTKGYTSLNTDVRPETKATLRALSAQFGCSMGELIDFLLFYYEHVRSEVASRESCVNHPTGSPATDDVQTHILEGITARLDDLRKQLTQVHQDVHRKTCTQHPLTEIAGRDLEPA
jgi:predicted RNase H-like HicB family nuclease